MTPPTTQVFPLRRAALKYPLEVELQSRDPPSQLPPSPEAVVHPGCVRLPGAAQGTGPLVSAALHLQTVRPGRSRKQVGC